MNTIYMEKNEMVSVIVPVYNVERYLHRCIRSILHQSYANIELILINDGSTDQSGEICNRYALKDSRIRVIHKKNEGVSIARNTGIACSSGTYITFVDGDDWLKRTAIEEMVACITKDASDLVVCDMEYVGSILRTKPKCSNSSIVLQLDNPSDYLNWYKTPWRVGGILYVADTIRKHHIKFPSGIKNGEDTIFALCYLEKAHLVSRYERAVYFYNRLVCDSAILRLNPDYCDSILIRIKKTRDAMLRICDEGREQEWCEVFLSSVKGMINHYASHEYEYLSFMPIFSKISERLRCLVPSLSDASLTDEFYNKLLNSILTDDCEQLYCELLYQYRRQKEDSTGIWFKTKGIIRKLKAFLLFDLGVGYWN